MDTPDRASGDPQHCRPATPARRGAAVAGRPGPKIDRAGSRELTGVFLNLFGNRPYAAKKRAKGKDDGSFQPVLAVTNTKCRRRRRGSGARQRYWHPRGNPRQGSTGAAS